VYPNAGSKSTAKCGLHLLAFQVGDAIAEEGKDVMIHYRFPVSAFVMRLRRGQCR
jgi:hypothetical protein